MKLLSLTKSDRAEKKYKATFEIDGKTKSTHFGSKGSSTFLDHKDTKKRSAYLARHRVREDWSNPITAGSLSRYLLWNKETLSASITDFKKRFNL